MTKTLLHACCGPCAVQCVEILRAEDITPTLFWYNPNIHPFTEYRSRQEALHTFAQQAELEVIARDEYGLRDFLRGVGQNFDDRCRFCYEIRLEAAAATAKAQGYDSFSTTLLVSPYQNHALLQQIGEAMGQKYGVAFLYRDFRPGFRQGQKTARELGLYMQKYCGCIFSEEDRYQAQRDAGPKYGIAL